MEALENYEMVLLIVQYVALTQPLKDCYTHFFIFRSSYQLILYLLVPLWGVVIIIPAKIDFSTVLFST